jgi:hypothetical protein
MSHRGHSQSRSISVSSVFSVAQYILRCGGVGWRGRQLLLGTLEILDADLDRGVGHDALELVARLERDQQLFGLAGILLDEREPLGQAQVSVVRRMV